MENPLDAGLGSHLEFSLDRPMEFQWKIRWTLDWVPIRNFGWRPQWNSNGKSVGRWNGFPFGILVGQANGMPMGNPLDVGLGSHLEFWLDRPAELQWKIRWALDWVPIWNFGWTGQ